MLTIHFLFSSFSLFSYCNFFSFYLCSYRSFSFSSLFFPTKIRVCRASTHRTMAQMYTANIMSLFLAAKLRTRSSLLRLGRRLMISCRRNIILLFAGSLPYFTSLKYTTISWILPYRPFSAWTFWKTLLSSEFRGISLIYRSRCSTPISSGSVASTFDSMWKNDL